MTPPRLPRASLAPTSWRRPLALLALSLLALSLAALSARPAAAQPALVPPRMQAPPRPTYPPGATGDAAVVVKVTVGPDGRVKAVEPLSGDEPFVSAALASVRDLTFEPATRGGKPITAIIRMEVSFREEKAQAPAAQAPAAGAQAPVAPGAQAPAGSAAPGGPEAPQEPPIGEVLIQADRPAPAVSSFQKAEVRQLPGAFGDPFRAIEALPGVTPIVSGLPFFYVRGAPPGNMGYYLDGVRVPYLFHVAVGPSVIHPGLVERVDLYPGGYPVSFGRFAGGIVSGETAPPRQDLHGEANLRLLDAGALVESGFADGRGSALVGGRYSYTAFLISLAAGNVKLDYRDYQARISYDVTPNDRVTLFTFGAYDLLAEKKGKDLNVLFGVEFYRADLRWDHVFDARTKVRQAVTVGYDRTYAGDHRLTRDFIVGVRNDGVRVLSDEAVLRFGSDVMWDAYRSNLLGYDDPDDPDNKALQRRFGARDDLAVGARADVVYRPAPPLEITPGLRVDFYSSRGATAVGVDPRFSTRLSVTPRVRLIGAYGVAHQPPSFVAPLPGFQPAGLEGGLQTALQSSFGVEGDLPSDVSATVTAFKNGFLAMSDAVGTQREQTQKNEEGGDNGPLALLGRSTGSAYGLEFFVKRKLSRRVGGFVSYTLSRSIRSVGNETFLAAFDRTHVLSAALGYDLGRRWRIGGRFVIYSGTPKKPAEGEPRTLHPQRDPSFYRLDLRLEKRWPIGSEGWMSLIFEMMNATLHKETISGQEIGPISAPSIGLEGTYR